MVSNDVLKVLTGLKREFLLKIEAVWFKNLGQLRAKLKRKKYIQGGPKRSL